MRTVEGGMEKIMTSSRFGICVVICDASQVVYTKKAGGRAFLGRPG